jgi:SAM-dependent methyltransferase
MSVTAETARYWVDRWDRQQEAYLPDREELFAVVADVVAAVAPEPVVVDLGCGAGSLSARLLARLPAARVVGVDCDPVLLALAEAAYRLPVVDHDLRDAGWSAALSLDRTADAVVSTTALHWLQRDELARVYGQAARLLRPGGVLVNGDDMCASPADGELARLTRAVATGRADRAGAPGEGWAEWWSEVTADTALATAVADRRGRRWGHAHGDGLPYGVHLDLLRAAGFREVGTVWQSGDRRVLVAVR